MKMVCSAVVVLRLLVLTPTGDLLHVWSVRFPRRAYSHAVQRVRAANEGGPTAGS